MTQTTSSPVEVAEAAPARPAGVDQSRRLRVKRRRRGLVAWGFALPFTLVFAIFMAFPVISSFGMSLTDMRGRDLKDPLNVDFIGLGNYTALFQDEQFLQAVRVTAIFVVIGLPATLAIALVLASLMNSGLVWFRSVFRVGYYMPVVTSIVAISVVWTILLQKDFGIVNSLLGLVGIDGPDWLHDETWALPSLIAMTVWRNVGYSMVILLAGLQGVPEDLYEAASLDGAGPIQKFRRITVPMLRPTILFCAVITGIGYLQFFEEPFVMTQGGPNGSTTSVAYSVFQQFGFSKYGYASAMSYVLFIAIVILTLLQFRLLRTEK